jgi:SAM-dependent methyltransferase
MPSRWEAFASREPYFAVLADARFLRANLDPSTVESFFRSGEDHVTELLAKLAALAPTFQPQSVLEYGCGIGRLAIPFARRGHRVMAVDESPAMLAHASTAIEGSGTGGIELMTAGQFERSSLSFDLVNCFLVFQRLRPAAGFDLLRRLAERVREGGWGVFHLPWASNAPAAVRLTRAIRERVPAVNALVNLARRKPAGIPLIGSHVYELNRVIRILRDAGFDAPHLIFRRDGDLEGVVVFAQRLHSFDATPATAGDDTPRADGFVDVRELIARTSIDELNAMAERYFSSLDSHEHHLAKPFASAADTPQLLISLGTLIQGLALEPGMTVLEYGSGTGWLSRFLTQLGCRMVLLDVSRTALDIARDLYSRQPVIGERPEPEFLPFDGRRIDLDDASVDRIICFDSFHHAPNPGDVLREFARVLRQGGIAGFIEPGPEHSRNPQSQYEMRTYGVVENDIDIHAIWREAQACGFTGLQLAAWNVPPFHVSLEEYEDLLSSGGTLVRWAQWSRSFMRDVRAFFLSKGEIRARDRKRPDGLRAAIEAAVAAMTDPSAPLQIHARVRNSGLSPWLPSDAMPGGVSLGGHLYEAGGKLLDLNFLWRPLPHGLAPGEAVEMTFELPPLASGSYILELDCVANEVAWFAQLGSPVTRLELKIA